MKLCISVLDMYGSVGSVQYMDFQFLKKLWNCVGGRVQQKFGFIKRVDEG